MRRTEQCRVRLRESEKERWEKGAEERDRPVSEFVRYCVNKELQGSNQEATPDEHLAEMIQSVDDTLSGGPGSIAHRLTAIEGQLKEGTGIRDLTSEVYSLLPDRLPDREGAMLDEKTHTETSGKPEHIARHIDGASPSDVRHALAELQNELHNVHEVDGRWYHD